MINNLPLCPQGIVKYVLNEYKILSKYYLMPTPNIPYESPILGHFLDLISPAEINLFEPRYRPHFMPVWVPLRIIWMFSILMYFRIIQSWEIAEHTIVTYCVLVERYTVSYGKIVFFPCLLAAAIHYGKCLIYSANRRDDSSDCWSIKIHTYKKYMMCAILLNINRCFRKV